MLRNRIKELLKLVEDHNDYLKLNETMLSIYKGGLLDVVVDKLRRQFSAESLNIAIERAAPINVLRRIIDKQSKIYSGGVRREVTGGTTQDLTVLSYMNGALKPDRTFGVWNAYFNLFKNSLVQPYLKSDGTPGVRVIPSDRFIPFSDDSIDPDNPTGFIIFMGTKVDQKGEKYKLYYAINANTFVYFTDREKDMTDYYSPDSDGINMVGVVPFVYLNRDNENILPQQDSDMLAMTTLIPILLTDTNFAHMFQAFSIFYGINLSDKGLKFSPNAFWSFETSPNDDRKPEIGTITPSVDINGSLSLIANQFALWLNSKGIKPGAVGDVSGSNFASGISKILDEMDTSEDRNEQIPYFIDGENNFWNLLLKHMLPFWQTRLGYNGIKGVNFSGTASVLTVFSEQIPLVRRSQLIDDSIKLLANKLSTRNRELKKLNPQFTEKQIEELESEIDAEETDAGESDDDTQQVG